MDLEVIMTVKIKATKTQNYAQKDPSKPCVLLVEGATYDLSDQLAARVVELKGGEPVKSVVSEIPEEKLEKVKVSEIQVENKEQKATAKIKRTPGQTKK